MGKDIYEKYEEVRNVYNTVKDITSIDVATFLLSDMSECITGQVIYADNGYNIMGV